MWTCFVSAILILSLLNVVKHFFVPICLCFKRGKNAHPSNQHICSFLLQFSYLFQMLVINLLYLPTLGGVIYHVLICGIKATWCDKLRSMFFLLDNPDLYCTRLCTLLKMNCLNLSHLNCRYADIYTSRVSNFLYYTPFMHFRSQEQVCR